MKHRSCKRCALQVAQQEWDGYSIMAALAVLKLSPRPFALLQPKDVDLSAVRGSVKDTAVHIHHVDARHPCIVVPRGARYVVIDGNHRAAKQLRRGRPVRAYVLTVKEAKQIREA